MSDKLEDVRRAVIAAVPGLSTKHLFDNGMCAKCGVTRLWEERTPRNQLTGEATFGYDDWKDDNVMIEVVKHDETDTKCYLGGRPIQLADVLAAMLPIEDSGSHFVEVQANGCISWIKKFENDIKESCNWNLHSPLESQPDETIAFLHKILCE